MKSIFINVFNVDFHRYISLLIIIVFIRQTSAGVLPSQDSVSLYTANDKVVILTNQNFSSTVYQSKTAWLIEFYASWCGHCQSYANTYREVAIDTWGWKRIVRIGAINCYTEENSAICDQHTITAFPTLRLIAPETTFNTSKAISLTANDAKDVERELIKELDALQIADKTWPRFRPLNQIAFSDIYSHAPTSVKLMLLIVEKQDDYTGRQIMLDFSKYHEQLTIFRTTIDGKLWHRFQLNITELPALLIVHPNRTTERINTKQNNNENMGSRNLFNYAIRSYIHEKKCIDDFNDRDLEEIIHSKNALKNADKLKISDTDEKKPDDVVETSTTSEKLSMVDLETALSYMLRREIPRIKEIQREAYDALLHWLTVLIKYFPGREPVMTYLKNLLSKVDNQPNGITGKKFREFADINTPESYLPNNQVRYQYCTGSLPRYRGYPCGLWLLFHTLTVSQVQSEPKRMRIVEIPSAVKSFIKHFFGCRHCSDNFMKETSDFHQLDSGDKNSAIIYLWKIHNHVNKRLHGDETEDPKHPKVQFPSENLCSTCQSDDNNFDMTTTLNFLLKFYSKNNIDLTSVEDFTPSGNIQDELTRKPSIDQYEMIEINHDSTKKFRNIRYIISIIQRFPFYFLIFSVIIIIIIRKRYCKGKRKRYTL
ncbi:unnamed protein product [Adineta steineri]|uniref:Sulfhydryl oxidase n=1 Tax=Adineta steineri TaxID=433720 RepID=A0A814W7R4_9BILA|nr:unnamed protein product [Adineta steineri]CAF3644358.1 unnamed protein product [Adineta steineri]